MTRKNNTALYRSILIGAAIAFALIALFLLPIRDPNPEWGKFWMVKPFVIVPLAGATGGLFIITLRNLDHKKVGKKVLLWHLAFLFISLVSGWEPLSAWTAHYGIKVAFTINIS